MSSIPLLRWQFDLTWSLFELHLDALTDADCLWEPAPVCWTVHADADGTWRADFAETEPDPVPAMTIGWLTWHIGWWWGSTLAAVDGLAPLESGDVIWPGTAAATVAWLRGLRTEWLAVLDRLDEDDCAAPAPYPWPADSSEHHTLAWVNAELMKNAAEIGQLRLVRAADADGARR